VFHKGVYEMVTAWCEGKIIHHYCFQTCPACFLYDAFFVGLVKGGEAGVNTGIMGRL
jgi:hypothetical protein